VRRKRNEGIRRLWSYDSANRLLQISQATNVVSFSYDAVNRRTSLTLPNGIVDAYSYDAASELTETNYTLAGTSLGNLVYSYDQDGRRIQLGGSFARTGIPLPISTTAYNAANELTQWGTANLFYDANGNMTSDGTNSFAWDARSNLVSINSGIDTFQYDPFGRRVSKTIGGTTTNFLYDGINPVQELLGTTVTANLLTGLSVDEYLARTDASGTSNFLVDALGSTLALADPTGTVQTQYTYDPFGGTTSQGAADANSYQFTGRENDGDGLYFYRARYYDPNVGRFLAEDPLRSPGDINLYRYAEDDPTDLIDPSGLQHMPGGPKHPPAGWKYRCKPSDNCATLSWKIAVFKGVIASHILWDTLNKTNRHVGSQEFQDFQRGLARCIRYHQEKCTNKPCKQPERGPQTSPAPQDKPLGAPLLPAIEEIIEELLGLAPAAA
jgi:RHS repeat-associated protein